MAYLLLRPVFKLRQKEPEGYQLFYIFLFANILDSAHFGMLRVLTHNLLGALLYSLLWLFIFEKLEVLKKSDGWLLLVAALIHIPGDLLFSSFTPFFPFSYWSPGLFPWNGPVDLVVESLLGLVFLAVLHRTGDLERLGAFYLYVCEVYEQGSRHVSVKLRFFNYYFLLLFKLFVFGQFLLALLLNLSRMMEDWLWWSWLFMLVFLGFSCALIFNPDSVSSTPGVLQRPLE